MNIVKGLEWAVAQGAQIINMSFAGPRDPILEQAIKRLKDKGIILIAAAGNAGPKSPPLFPGADANVIAVSATDVDDKTYKNANRGKHVAIAAPGVDILVPAPDGGYQLTTGTSVAAAHISGVVALMLERNPRLTPADVRSILSATRQEAAAGPQRGRRRAGRSGAGARRRRGRSRRRRASAPNVPRAPASPLVGEVASAASRRGSFQHRWLRVCAPSPTLPHHQGGYARLRRAMGEGAHR